MVSIFWYYVSMVIDIIPKSYCGKSVVISFFQSLGMPVFKGIGRSGSCFAVAAKKDLYLTSHIFVP